jgi:hypothetical protein
MAVECKLGQKSVALGIILIAVLSVSIIATIEWLGNVHSDTEFFVGVEFAYSDNVCDLKDLVDKVKNYTNLFVVGALEISFNQTALNEACDYVVDSGLHLIVFFTDSTIYNYTIFDWMVEAKQKYGDKFLGVYRYDEPGGNQMDQSSSRLVKNATSYADAVANYTKGLGIIIEYYLNYSPKMFTADYGLYWFDYKAGYSAVFAEFGWNHSRPLHIALCRGAAKAYNKDWGAIVTWEYTDEPYIESGEELYDDMILAYKTGAKYIVVFDYPKIGQYGILNETKGHFGALKDFWNYVHSNPQEHGVIQGEVAYVLPQDYGFGFRNAEDKIWGLWNDDLSPKVWADANTLINQYGSRLDIVYSDPEIMDAVRSRYDRLFFWNGTISQETGF